MNRAAVVGILVFCATWPAPRQSLAAQEPDAAELHQIFEQGHDALAHGRFAEAEADFRKLIQLDPAAAIPEANLGLVYFQERKFAEAIPAFQRALKLDAGLSNARYFLAMSLSEMGHYQEALPGLEEGFRSESDPKLKRLLGLHLEKAYTGVQRDRDAVAAALQLTALYPNDAEVLYQAARLCANYSYLSIQKLGRVAPDSVWRRLASGDFYETQGRYALAEREYRAVLAQAPRMPGIHYRLGRALLRSSAAGAQSQALSEFRQELALDPTNASAAFEAGQILRKTGKLAQASQMFSAALLHYPDYEDAERELGLTLILQHKPQQALGHLQKAVQLDPADAAAYYQLAQCYHALGDAPGEQRASEKFRALNSQKHP